VCAKGHALLHEVDNPDRIRSPLKRVDPDKFEEIDKRPADAASIVKDSFKTKGEAEKALKAAAPPKAEGAAPKPVKLPDKGC